MSAQSAGEQAVAVSVVNDVVLGEARGHKTAPHELRPGVDVALRVADHGGCAGCAGRGVQAHDIAHRRGKKPEGIIVPQILLGGERKTLQIIEGFKALRRHTRPVKRLFVKTDGMVKPRGNLLESFELQRFERLPGQGFKFFIVDHGVRFSSGFQKCLPSYSINFAQNESFKISGNP